jgi:hypothetical protein
MEMTLTFPDDIGKKLQSLPKPNEFILGLLKEAFQNQIIKSKTHQLKTLERIKQHRAKILAERGQPIHIDVVKILQEIREERNANFQTSPNSSR